MNRFTLVAVILMLGLIVNACGGGAPTDPAAAPGTDPAAAPGTDPAVADPGTDPAADPGTDTNTGTDTGTDMDTDTNTNTDMDTDTNTDTDTDAGADTGTDEMAVGEDTIVSVAQADGRFTVLLTSLETAGLADALNGEGPFTVFAPTDDAFASLPPEIVEGLATDPLALTDILSYHVVDGTYTIDNLAENEVLPTIQGEEITITAESEAIMLNGTANVIAEAIETSNGFIYVIDSVILPPSLDTAEG